MKTKGLVLMLLALLSFQACKKKTAAEFNSDFSLFKGYISSFTSVIVPAHSDFRVALAFDKKEWKTNQLLDADLFSISPSINGKVIALSSNTIAFVPESKLEQNTEYQITFHLGKIIKVPEKLQDFNFTVKTIKQDFVLVTNDIQSYSKDYQYLNCSLKTADEMDSATASKLIVATQKGKKLKIKFDFSSSSKSEFRFVVDSIRRFAEDSEIMIDYDGTEVGIDQKGSIKFPIVGKDHFEVIDVKVPEGSNQSMLINFSDALQPGQNFNGLVTVEGAQNLKFSIQGNVLKVFLEQPLKGELLVEVFQGISSEEGFRLKQTYTEKVSFEQIKPNVRLLKNGSILPSSSNLKINFEAVNLKAVDVKIYKIYKNNILQFLQENDINGSRNLRQVAQPVAAKTINLHGNKLLKLDRWNTFALDLSKLITPDPGAIYRVEFAFKKKYSLFECAAPQLSSEDAEEEEIADENDVNYSGDSYDDYYYDDYEWRERQDPCTPSYYYNTKIAANVLASDLGVIAKRGENKSYFFAVNNLLTTEPVWGAKIEIYSYQMQKLGAMNTNAVGTAYFKIDSFAYFAIVTLGKNSTYLKLDDGTALSVSNFDVAGETLQKGLKGFIYGERGVWRPGDNLFLSFILDDSANKLPIGNPIKLRISDPNGKIVYQNVKAGNPTNHYAFTVPTDADAPTGNWEARVSVGGANFYKSIKVETIKPNRLRVKATFNTPLLSPNNPNTLNLAATWLHGAIAKNLKTEITAKFTQQNTAFKNYPTFHFDDDTKKFATEEINVFSGHVDQNGHASVNIKPELEGEAPGMLKAAFITKVYEQGGDFSTDVMTATYSPYNTYVGLKLPEPNKYGLLETRKNNHFEVVTVDENGRPKATSGLEVKVYKVEWRWWWDASEDNLSNYNADNGTTVFKSFKMDTGPSGKAAFDFALEDDDWGRYLIRVSDGAGGHSVSQTALIDYPYWSGKTRKTDASSANMLVFTTDKKNYAVGETAHISFPSSEGSRALISIENGTKVLKALWTKTLNGETRIDVPITADMAPNVYFNISLLQPHANTKNDSPIRLYGIIPIEVVDKNTKLEPQLQMPDVLKPEQFFNVKVSEKSGRKMTYTIAIVDEGLLDLTRFKTPNAWDSFYTRAALGVKTWDVYNDVIGAYGGKVNQIFSIGGDQDLGGGKAKKANRFEPVVIYLGPFVLEKGQTKTHKVQLPKYVGSVRTMVTAADVATSAYGSAEKATPVKSPLMVLASMPRKISPSEQVIVPVTVFAMEANIRNVKVQLQTSANLKIMGERSQNISFSHPDEQLVYFKLGVGNSTGIGKIKVVATSGSQQSSYEVEIDLTNPNPLTSTFKDIVLESGQSKTIEWQTFGVAGSNAAQFEVSSIPTIDLNNKLQYLITYPHGCVEQTTSSVFPQLFLSDVADLTAERRTQIQQNVTAGIKRLAGFQMGNGGFVYWPGNTYADDWGSSYAGHFLSEAEKKGYVLPIGCKAKWIAYQQKEAKTSRFYPQYGNDLAQAYRLYTLALAGSADLSSMNRLRETSDISNESKLRLAAAYVLAGQKSAGSALLAKTAIDQQQSRRSYFYYGSPERNRAMTLETLLLLGEKSRAFTTAMKLANEMGKADWMSTQTTAYCLYAMSKFAQQNGSKGIAVTYTKEGKSETINSEKTFADRRLGISPGANKITIKNTKNNTVFVRVLNSGILPVGKEQPYQSNLAAAVVFKNRKGELINVTKVSQGTEFIAVVTVRNLRNERVEHVALTQILPSGFEIVNTRFTDYGDAVNNVADYIDIRDDRTNFYFDLKANEVKTFQVLVNASYLGVYYLPGLQCEAMYDHSYLARTKGQWVEVVK